MRKWFLMLVALCVATQGIFNGARVLVSYRILDFGGDAATVGVYTAAFSLVPLLIAVPAGRLVDDGSAPAVMRAGLVATLGAAAVMALSPNLPVLMAGYVLMGFAHMVTLIAAQGMVAKLRGSTAGLDSLFAYFTLGISVGQFAGILFSGWIAAMGQGSGGVDTTPALWALVAVGVPALIAGWVHAGRFAVLDDVRPAGSRPGAGGDAGRGAAGGAAGARSGRGPGAGPGRGAGAGDGAGHDAPWAILGRRGMPQAMLASVSVIVAIDLLTAYMPVVGAETGMSVGEVTMVLSARSGLAIVSRALMPGILRRHRRDRVMLVAVVAGVVPLAVMPWLGNAWAMAVAVGICGFAWGLVMPMTMTWVSQLARESDKAMALSVRLMGNRLAQVAVPPAAGAVAAGSGAATVFVFAGVLMAVATAGTFHAAKAGTLPR
ncbi:MFS transporter [Corynebacterium sp. 335C]